MKNLTPKLPLLENAPYSYFFMHENSRKITILFSRKTFFLKICSLLKLMKIRGNLKKIHKTLIDACHCLIFLYIYIYFEYFIFENYFESFWRCFLIWFWRKIGETREIWNFQYFSSKSLIIVQWLIYLFCVANFTKTLMRIVKITFGEFSLIKGIFIVGIFIGKYFF